MYTKAAVLATSATSLPMWGPEGYRMVPLPNMVADFRDSREFINVNASAKIEHFSSVPLVPFSPLSSRSFDNLKLDIG